MKTIVHIGYYIKRIIDFPFKPQVGETVIFPDTFYDDIDKELTDEILKDWDSNCYLGFDFIHHYDPSSGEAFAFWSYGYERISKAWWEQNYKTHEMEYHIELDDPQQTTKIGISDSWKTWKQKENIPLEEYRKIVKRANDLLHKKLDQ